MSLSHLAAALARVGYSETLDGRPPWLPEIGDAKVMNEKTAQFRDALLGSDDVAVPRFMRACRAYADCVLQRMGPFTLLSIREVHSNMRKVQLTHDIDPSTLGTMRAILQREIAGAMHQPGAQTQQQSLPAQESPAWPGAVLRFQLWSASLHHFKASKLHVS